MDDIVPPRFAAEGLFFARRSDDINHFQVIGERSSGTNFVSRTLGRNTSLTPSNALGWKHGAPQMLFVPRNLVVVVCVRKADAWARSMFSKPWHASKPMQRLEFGAFLRAPWASIIDRKRYFTDLVDQIEVGQPLQLDRDPITGKAYDNLFKLRSGKLRSHLSFLNRDCNLCLVRSERAAEDPEGFVAAFRDAFGVDTPHDAFRPVRKRLGSRFLPSVEGERTPPDQLAPEDLDFLRSQCDLPLEASLGYQY